MVLAFGRVDSAPISRISAPCSMSARAWLMEAGALSQDEEKESGVTFQMPIIFGVEKSRADEGRRHVWRDGWRLSAQQNG